ncbi:hypothetical protein ACSRUE_05130 [Sorangium sp. KYC3313]|uniref:hypothetical protein n=1 Tax=Sorangium sp. KYC3313 TaxID=3449740 RepID=UPI003F8A33F7
MVGTLLINPECQETVRANFAGFFRPRHGDSALLGEDDLHYKIAWLNPVDILVSDVRPGAGWLVKNAPAMRVHANFLV